ncbi:calymmin isoform X5 [Scophthalmus maximus]|uniref:calymmin isoform X5 n=1 Tax=Scophthalmus maximus TaxID=52904 RepID=UPI001FA84CB0|nr:calymmin isoform X5 [Scophthalmus maximus]
MLGQLLFQSAVTLWLVQTAYTGGYGAASGVSNGQGPQPNGNKLQNGGALRRMLIPSKGVGQAMGAQNGYGGHPTKGIGYGAAAGVSSANGGKSNGYGAAADVNNGRGVKGYGGAAGVTNGQGGKPQGYGVQAGPANGQQMKGNGYGAQAGGYGVQAGPANGQKMKGNGYGAQAGGYGGQGTKGNGYGAPAAVAPNGNGGHLNGYGAAGVLGGTGAKPNGNNAAAAGHNGFATKGKGQGAAAGPSNGSGVRPNGQGGAGSKPMKGYGRPSYGAGPGVGMGTSRGLGVPQLARNQGMGYGRNGYNGYRAQPMAGFNGGHGHAGLGLGSRNGNGGMKGPMQGTNGAAGVPNGQGAKPNGYAGARAPNGNGAMPNGYGYPNGGTNKPAKPGYGSFLNGYGATPKGYGATRGGAMRPQPGYGNGAIPNGHGRGRKPNGYGAAAGAGVPNGYGAKPNGQGVRNGAAFGGYGGKLNGQGGPSRGSNPTTKGVGAVSPREGAKTLGTGYGGPAGVPNGQLAQSANTGYGMMPNGKGTKGAGASNGKGLKGGVFSPVQSSAAPEEGVPPQQAITQGKSYKQIQLTATLEPALALPQANDPNPIPGPAPMGPQGKGPKATASGPEPVFPQSNQAPKPAAVLPQENGGATSVTKGQGAKPAKPDCGPSGVPNGQWMKIPRPDYNAGAGASTGMNTKGYGAGAGVPNTYGAKPNGYDASAGGTPNGGASKPGYGAGGYTVPGLSNGYGGALRYPYAGNPEQPGYGQGAYLGAGHGNSYGGNAHAGEAGKSKSGYGNGYSAGVQPDYASFGQGVPTADAKSGGARQVPYNGAPVVPAGLDGISQFEPQSAGLGPNGKLGSMYGGMGGLPFGGQKLGMGAEKSSAKYGIGGLQFGGQPLSTGTNGAGQHGYGGGPYGPEKSPGNYGGLGTGMGGDPGPGKYGFPSGYGRMPYEAQPAGLNPEVKSTGTYGLAGSPYQPEPLGLGHNGKLTSQYGGGEVPYSPQALGFSREAKSVGQYGNQGSYQSQPLESAYEGRSGGEYDTAGLPYESLPSEPDSAVKSYAKGGVPTPATAVEGEGMSVDRYDHLGYIYGHVQPEVVAFPAAPTPSPTMAYPSGPSYLPEEASFTPDVLPGAGAEDLPDPAGTASLDLDSAPATETHGVIQLPEQPDDLLQEQLPRQIHIQQHLKLHFHPQGEKNGKHDLNGFFGNSGYQG